MRLDRVMAMTRTAVRPFSTHLLVAFAGLFAAAACGGSGTASPGGSVQTADATPDAVRDQCDWLTPAEVSAAIGIEVGDGIPTEDWSCTFEYTSESGIRTDIVFARDDLFIPENIEEFRLDDHGHEAVAGLGDAAFFLEARSIDAGNSVLVVKHSARIFTLGGEFLTLEQARILANVVLSRWERNEGGAALYAS